MAIRDDFFTALTNGAKWDVGVSINRTNPLPLDQYSVFESEAKLDAYISGAFAYPGQIVAVIGESETKIYYLDQNKAKQPVGIIPSGDSKTIEVTAQGAISLLGAAAAPNGTLPMLEGGKLVWKTLEDIGAGDGNDDTTYEFTKLVKGEGDAAECYGFSVKPLFNGQPIKDEDDKEITFEIALDVYTKSEVDTKIKAVSDVVGNAESGLVKDLADEAQRAKDAEKALDDKIALAAKAADVYTKGEVDTTLADYAKTADVNKTFEDYTTTADLTTLLAAKADKEAYNQTVKDLDDLEAKVDAFLTGTGTEAALDSLQELIAYIDEHDGADLTELFATVQGLEDKLAGVDETVVAYVTAAIDALKIGDYAKAADLTALANRVAALEAKPFDTYATKTEVEGVDAKFADYTKTADLQTYLTGKFDAHGAAAQALTDANTHADEELAKKVDKKDGYGLLSSQDQAKLDKLTLDDGELSISGTVEAGSVKNLDSWINTNRDLVAGLYPSADATKLGGIAAGAQVNVLEGVKVNGTDLAIEGKKVNIDLSAYALQTGVNAVSERAEKGITDAKAAKDAADAAAAVAAANGTTITGLDTRLQAAETKGNDNAAAIAAHTTEFATLKGRVDAHDTTLLDKANKSDVYTKEQVNAITGTPAEGKTLVAMIAEKANAADVYTKDETNAAIKVVTDSIGTVPAGSSVMAEIAKAQEAATYDDTKVKEDIKANADAIVEITKEGGLIATAKAEAIAAATYNDTEVKASIKANTDAIAILNGDVNTDGSVDKKIALEVAKIIDDADESDIDTLNEIAAWITNDTTGAAKMNADILANTAAIKTINETTIPAAIETAKGYTDTKFTNFNTDVIAPINEAINTTIPAAIAQSLVDAKKYTDDEVAKILPDGTSIVKNDEGKFAVNQVSTDKLVQGTETLVLFGGSANVATEA